jgi:hypothetical protein
LKGPIVSGNTAPQDREVFTNGRQYVTTGRFNLFGFNGSFGMEGFSPEITDIVPSQPLGAILNPRLANNGGPTQTHALLAGSPAIDAINDRTCPPPAKDQRGVPQPQDGNGDDGPACGIGAYEYVFAAPCKRQRLPKLQAHLRLHPRNHRGHHHRLHNFSLLRHSRLRLL